MIIYLTKQFNDLIINFVKRNETLTTFSCISTHFNAFQCIALHHSFQSGSFINNKQLQLEYLKTINFSWIKLIKMIYLRNNSSNLDN